MSVTKMRTISEIRTMQEENPMNLDLVIVELLLDIRELLLKDEGDKNENKAKEDVLEEIDELYLELENDDETWCKHIKLIQKELKAKIKNKKNNI